MPYTLDDALNMEGEVPDAEAYYTSVQRAINAGIWSNPGRDGRAMMAAIEAGRTMLGRKAFRDYWGNAVPSREDVQPGTKGSMDYVIDRFGKEWADKMADIE